MFSHVHTQTCVLYTAHNRDVNSFMWIQALISRKELLKLEKKIWDALVSGDRAADSELLSDDFTGVYPSGFEGKEDHFAQLDSGPTIQRYRLSNVSMKVLSTEVTLLCYRADFSRAHAGETNLDEIMYVTSIW